MRLWFYVPDYPKVREYLEVAYLTTGVEEWSAEPGRVRGCPDDADVTVDGDDEQLARFWNLLRDSRIEGLQLEGRRVSYETRPAQV